MRVAVESGQVPGSGRPLLMKVGRVFDGLQWSAAPDGWVLLEEGRIQAVGVDGEAAPADMPDVLYLDLGPNSALLPGLIDAHVHLVCTGGPASILEAADQDESVLEDRAVINSSTCLASGVTTVRDAGGKGLTTLRARDRLRARNGLDVLASGTPVTTRGGHLHFFGMEADDVTEVRRCVQWLADAGADCVKVMASPGIQTPGNDPYSSQYSAEALSALVKAAHQRDMHVLAHAHSIAAIENCVSANVDTIEHFSWLGEDPDLGILKGVAKEVAARGIRVDPTTIGLDSSVGPEGGLTKRERGIVQAIIDRRRACLQTLASAGVEILPGTDAGSTGVHFQDMVRGLSLLQRLLGWTGASALRAATSASADAIGRGGDIGTVSPGMKADLLVVDGAPGDDLADLSRVLIVVKAGAVVVDNRSEAPRLG